MQNLSPSSCSPARRGSSVLRACLAPALLLVGVTALAGAQDGPPPPVKVPAKQPVSPKPVPVAGRDGVKPAEPVSPEDKKKLEAFDELQKQKAAGALPAGPRPPVNPKAKLEIPFGNEKHDFGLSRQGDLLTHEFQLASSGEEPVIISQASPTCGCTVNETTIRLPGSEEYVPYVLGTEIPPGSDVRVGATLDTSSKSNQTQVRINVYSNDPVGVMSLSLNANVEPFLRATPAFLQLGDVPQGQERTGLIDIRTTRGESVLLTEDTARQIPVPAGFSYELKAVNPDAEGKSAHWQVSMRVSADADEGPHGYAMTLLTDVPLPVSPHAKDAGKGLAPGKHVPTVYSINSNVNYRVLGVISLNPQYLSMGLVRPGSPVVRNVKLVSQDPNFDLSNVSVSIEGENGEPLQWAEHFSAEVKPALGMNAVDIQLSLDGLPEGADGSFRGVMVVKTGHPSKPQELVRFSGVCRKLAGVPTGK
ncbi:MAG: DUF1573 domain-containing protein [Planctomycetota bacterium]